MFVMDCIIGGANLAAFMGVFKLVIQVVQYAVPVALILWGTIDLFKSIISSKEDEIKKKQTLLFKKVLSAVIIFLLPWLVFTLMSLLGGQVGEFGSCYKSANPGLPELGADTGYGNGGNTKTTKN